MYSPRGGHLGATAKVGPWASKETWTLVRATPDKFYIHMSVDGIVSVDVKLFILPSCGLSYFVHPPLVWVAIPCLLAQSAKFVKLSVQDLNVSRFPHSLDEITAFRICLMVYTIFKLIHTYIPLFSTNINGADNWSHSFVHQLFLSFLNTFSSLGCSYTSLKLNTCRGDVLA